MNRRTFLAASSGATIAGLAGCFGGDDGLPDVDEEDIVVEISVDNREFDPMKPEIEPGEAVRWNNDSDESYVLNTNDTYDETANWDLEYELEPGDSVAFLFEDAGYYAFHEDGQTALRMCGAVAVGEPADEMPELMCEGESGE
ncbi:hypothetical protein [Halomontanus rarus]|uniref:hypothetical protein n=1 Tax=Halomontanus rarus TaxID=3034020 RepID=UPI001A99E6BF